MNNFRFPGQNANEKVNFVIRKHWIVHAIGIAKLIVISIFPVLIILGLAMFFIDNFFQFDGTVSVILFFTLFLFIFLLQYSFTEWINDELDLFIITNSRVIDITQVSFLRRKIAEAPLDQIQDVKGETKGFFGTLLNFGTLMIATANQKTVFEISDISRPESIARKMSDAVQNKDANLKEDTIKKYDADRHIMESISKIKTHTDFFSGINGMRKSVIGGIRGLFQKK